MTSRSRSQRIVAALKELAQFQATSGVGPAICTLTGVRVEASADPLGIDHGKIFITFPGATSFEASGEPYLEVQMRECVRTQFAEGEAAQPAPARRLDELRSRLYIKHEL